MAIARFVIGLMLVASDVLLIGAEDLEPVSRPGIVPEPDNVQVTEVTTNSLTVTWNQDEEIDFYYCEAFYLDTDGPPLQIYVGKKLPSPVCRPKLSTAGAKYRIGVANIIGDKMSNIVSVEERLYPVPLKSLTLVDASENSIRIILELSRGYTEKFVLSISPEGDPDNIIETKEVPIIDKRVEGVVEFSNLQPDVQYVVTGYSQSEERKSDSIKVTVSTLPPDPCSENPCQNEGICRIESAEEYVCDCKPGYFGINCENDPCSALPCENDAECWNDPADTDIGYRCSCEGGYSGVNCEIVHPIATPTNLRVGHVTTDSITILWDADQESEGFDFEAYYEPDPWTGQSRTLIYKATTFTTQIKQVILTNLVPGSNYIASVASIVGDRTSERVSMQATTYPSPLERITQVRSSSNTSTIAFQPGAGSADKFDIVLSLGDMEIDRKTVQVINGEFIRDVQFLSLEPETTYTVSGVAHSGDRSSTPLIRQIQTRPTSAHSGLIWFIELPPDSIRAVWDEVENADFYRCEVFHVDKTDQEPRDRVLFTNLLSTPPCQATVVPGEKYLFVVANVSSGETPGAVSTKRTIRPLPPKEVIEYEVGTNFISLIFDPPIGHFDDYLISIAREDKPDSPVASKVVEAMEDMLNAEATFDLLEDGTTYIIRVLTRSDGVQSEEAMIRVQTKRQICPPHARMDAVFVLDSSSSLGHHSWARIHEFAKGILSFFTVSDDASNFAALRYDRNLDKGSMIQLKEYSDDRAGLLEAFDRIKYAGVGKPGTRTGLALLHAWRALWKKQGNRPEFRDVVLLITDGKSLDRVDNRAKRIRSTGAEIIVVGVYPPLGGIDEDELRQISGSDDHLIMVDGPDGLTREIILLTLKKICAVVAKSDALSPEITDELKEIQQEKNRCSSRSYLEHGEVACTNGREVGSICRSHCSSPGYALHPYYTENSTCLTSITWNTEAPCCRGPCVPGAKMDVVFVLDSSSSLGVKNWLKIRNLVKDIIRPFTVSADAVNFAAFRYNKEVDESSQIMFSSYPDNKTKLLEAIDRMPYEGSGTFTGRALAHVTENILTESAGDRPDYPNVVVLIKEGKKSHDDMVASSLSLRKQAKIVVVGIAPPRNDAGRRELFDLAGSLSNLKMVANFQDIDSSFAAAVVEMICVNLYCPIQK